MKIGLFERLNDRWRFLILPDTWHKHWPFRNFCCWIGRHDYEPVSITGPYKVFLHCVYCEHQRLSTFNIGQS